MNVPTLSVLMPNYNHAKLIPAALDAMLSQAYEPLEIIVLDDGSTDESLQVLESYRLRRPDLIRVLRNECNRGGLAGASDLLSMARGDFVFFSAMDDYVLPGLLGQSMALLARFPRAGVCSTLSEMMDAEGRRLGPVRMPVVSRHDEFMTPVQVRRKLLAHGNWFQGNTVIYRRSALIEEGGFDASLGPYADGFLYLVLALKHGACFIPRSLAMWRRMPDSYSNRTSRDIAKRISRLQIAERLMRTRYASLFVPRHIDVWRREMYFGAASQTAAEGSADWFREFRMIVPASNALDASFDALARRWPAAARRLAKPYLFSKLKHRFLFRTLQRRARHWFLR